MTSIRQDMNVGRISEPAISKNMSAFELFNTSLSSLRKLSHHTQLDGGPPFEEVLFEFSYTLIL